MVPVGTWRRLTFVARQKRIRIGDEWYRIDLLLFHRRLRCLVVIDLKIGKFTHADAGQMNLYLNYVQENMTEPGENDPVGLILCSARMTPWCITPWAESRPRSLPPTI